ncbi:MFS transporter [Kosakonia sacchari]|uniref:MFS transporter n=1 Tax=Kosakonia sacchari TaxID=1158459 RepID=UPI0032D93E29
MQRLTTSAYLMLGANLVSNIGNGMRTLVAGIALYNQSGSAMDFGIVIVLEYIVLFVVNVLAGPWADRYNPKYTMLVVDLLRGITVCLVCTQLNSGYLFFWIALLTVVVQVGKPFYRSSTFVLEPALVKPEQLTRYNGFAVAAMQLGQLVGISLAGLVLSLSGVQAALMITGLSFLLSALSIAFVIVPSTIEYASHHEGRGLLKWFHQLVQDWVDVAKFMRRNKGLTTLTTLGVSDYLTPSFLNIFLAILVVQRFEGAPYALSLLDGSFALGAMLSGLFADRLVASVGPRLTSIIGITGQGLMFIGIASGGPGEWAVAATFFIGVMNSLSYMGIYTTLQLRIKGPFKGRISLVRSLIATLLACIFIPPVTHLSDSSLTLALIAAGSVSFGFSLVVLIIPSIILFPDDVIAKTKTSEKEPGSNPL